MPIQLLLPQLANQIAAGEIVYRPSSVVKELIENSLDAGATRIDIDIEQGGTKCIRIRDNGSGIAKDELALALARHATSKIASIEDLERITSLGFRGEALASVSSVSRLNLTSRIAEQSEAWQAYKEGRNLAITIKPAAHPVGTTIEVLDLFYNTPARRKFMSTAKNEFTHIDDVTRRIALSRFDVTFRLQHNGKIVRQYRAASQKNQHQRRLVRLCGPAFVKQAMGVSYHNGDLTLHGWIANTDGIAIPALKYSYVNRRTMNDRFINHIIRKVYKEKFNKNQQPAFVLFLEIDPYQIDVNFHPTKHKVRFYQDRLVHDFIYQAVANTLQQYSATFIDGNESYEQNNGYCSISKILPVVSDDVLLHDKYGTWPLAVKRTTENIATEKPLANIDCCKSVIKVRDKNNTNNPQKAGYLQQQLVQTSALQENTANSVQQQTENRSSSQSSNENTNAGTTLSTINIIAQTPFIAEPNTANYTPSFGTVLTIFEYCYALIQSTNQLALISLPSAERYLNEHKLIPGNALFSAQKLIIPLHITLCNAKIATLKKYQFLLQEMGLYLQPDLHQAILHTVPLLLSKQNLQNLIPEMLNYLTYETVVTNNHIAVWIARKIQPESGIWSQLQAIQLLAQVERLCPQWVQNPPHGFMVQLNFEQVIKALNYE